MTRVHLYTMRCGVVLLVDEGDGRCRVVDERGLYVQVSRVDVAPL